jgi:hypothetical protein
MNYCNTVTEPPDGDSDVSFSLFPIVSWYLTPYSTSATRYSTGIELPYLRLLQLHLFILVIIVLLPRTDTIVPCAKAPSTHTLSRLWRIWAPQRIQQLAFPLPRTTVRIWTEAKTRCHNIILQIGTRPIETQRVRPMSDAPATVARYVT